MDRRLSLYWCGDHSVAAYFVGSDRRSPRRCFWRLVVSPVINTSSFQSGYLPIFFRGTPLYVQLLVFYSGMYTLEIVKGTEFLNAFFRSGLNCTVLALTLNTCAYTTEIFCWGNPFGSAWGKLKPPEPMASRLLKCIAALFLPSALRIALPAYSNEVILMLHSTALAFTATVPDLLKIARDINAATYQPFTAFGIAAVLYLIISYVPDQPLSQSGKTLVAACETFFNALRIRCPRIN